MHADGKLTLASFQNGIREKSIDYKMWKMFTITMSDCIPGQIDPKPFHKKGPVKLIQRVKVALLFLHVTSKLLQFTILKLSG